MSLPEVSRFLSPISEDRPTGEWLRFDPLYDEIKLLREKDDPTLPQGVWQRELKKADWSGVARICENALESRTKDLQVAAWMTEAWMDLHGFRGFERGIQVVAGLCRTFWDNVYPVPEDGSIEPRLAPIVWIADKLTLPLKSISLTAAAGEETMAYAWRDWESANFLAKTSNPKTPVPEKAVTQSKFMVAVSLTPAARFVSLETDLFAALAALDDLNAALTEKLGANDTPSLTPLRTPILAMQQFVTRVRAERGERSEALVPADPAATAGEEGAMAAEVITSAVPVGAGGPIATRAEAYHRLREAADYLMRTEPHSPVPYLVRRAISWGNLSLSELLEELLQKNADLTTINTLLGIRKS
ncbi:MAG TPA: type VI secretion system protein TssA [Thermoanaerobaculia bacterium]|nr:type VI secretion system protein TssA [Thermoanaerobaculia bacterium]